VGFTRKD